MIKKLSLILLLLSISAASAAAADRLSVFVSIVPQKTFVQQIGKDLVDINVMVTPGASPATYEPKPRQMAELSNAALYFAIGAPFERTWLRKIAAANPRMTVVHTDKGIEKLAMAAHYHGEEGHEEDNHHAEEHHEKDHHDDGDDHTGLDPHIWTSPALVKIQAAAILKALQKADPANEGAYADNFKAFIAGVDALDRELSQTFAGKKGLQFMVFHPSWGYFARDYGLTQIPIEIEGKDPKPAQLKELISHAREEGIKVIFVQPQFSTKSATLIAREIKGQVAFADPLAEDWAGNLRMIAEKFSAVLK